MNAIIRNIPNYITLSNLCCGALSIIFTFNNQLDLAALLIFTGVALDFFDGFFARILKVDNELGIQLDSMADLITSGIAPSFILFKLMATTTSLHTVYKQFANSLRTVCTKLANSLHIDSKQFENSLHTVCKQFAHSFHIVCTA